MFTNSFLSEQKNYLNRCDNNKSNTISSTNKTTHGIVESINICSATLVVSSNRKQIITETFITKNTDGHENVGRIYFFPKKKEHANKSIEMCCISPLWPLKGKIL